MISLFGDKLVAAFIHVSTVPLKGKLPPLVSFLARITDAFSMAYITRKERDMCNGCCSAVRWQIDGTVQNIRYASVLYLHKLHKKNYMDFNSCEHEGKELILRILFSIIFQS